MTATLPVTTVSTRKARGVTIPAHTVTTQSTIVARSAVGALVVTVAEPTFTVRTRAAARSVATICTLVIELVTVPA